MTRRLFFRVIAVGVLILLLSGIAGCNGLFAESPLNLISAKGQPSAGIFVSQQAPAMVSFLVNPDRLQVVESRGKLSQLKTRLFANTAIDYQDDIQPWLGNEITLAVTTLDIDRDPENGEQPGYLMVLATDQPEKSREFVELFFSKRALAGKGLTVEKYKGVKLIYDNPQEIPVEEKKAGGYFSTKNRQAKTQTVPAQVDNLAGASVGNNFVLFANDPKVLREAINNVQAVEQNLTYSSQYQTAINQLPEDALAVVFLNLPAVAKWQGLKPKYQIYDSQFISFRQTAIGLLAETALSAKDTPLPQSVQLSKALGALQYLPTSASLALTGSNLSSLGNSNLALLWRQVTATAFGSEGKVFSKLLPSLADVEKRWGINWQEDIFRWVDGEYALGLLPHQDKPLPDWIFVVEKSQKTAEAIARFNAIASSEGFSVNSLNLDGQKVFAWTELTTVPSESATAIQAKVLGTYTDVGNYQIFASSIEAMQQALTAKDNSLMTNSSFQDSVASLPQPNQGYVYLDWTRSQEMLEHQIPVLKLVEVFGQPFFQDLRSLTASSYGSDSQVLKGGVLFQFKS